MNRSALHYSLQGAHAVLFAAVAAMSVVGCDQKAPDGRVVDPENINASELYERKCAVCHGPEGRGDGPGRRNYAFVADFTDPEVHARLTDDHVTSAVRTGYGQMPRLFGLHDLELAAVAEHIRNFADVSAGQRAPAATSETSERSNVSE